MGGECSTHGEKRIVACVIRLIKSRRMRCEGNAARMGEKRNAKMKAKGKETTRKIKT
jgi:hypothetical protein